MTTHTVHVILIVLFKEFVILNSPTHLGAVKEGRGVRFFKFQKKTRQAQVEAYVKRTLREEKGRGLENQLMRTKLKRKGLTLIELLVALSIMALGMAVVVPAYKRSRERANIHSMKMHAEGVRDGIQNCIQRASLWAKTEQRQLAQCDTLQKLGIDGYCPICFPSKNNGSLRQNNTGRLLCVDMKQKDHNACVSCEGRSCTSCVDPKDPNLEVKCPSGCPPDKGFKCQHSGSCSCA